jgi:hypothetical protein
LDLYRLVRAESLGYERMSTWNVKKPNELARGVKKRSTHAWYHVKGFRFPWPVCANCGLVWLKNAVSIKAAKAPCEWTEDA